MSFVKFKGSQKPVGLITPSSSSKLIFNADLRATEAAGALKALTEMSVKARTTTWVSMAREGCGRAGKSTQVTFTFFSSVVGTGFHSTSKKEVKGKGNENNRLKTVATPFSISRFFHF